MGYREPKRLKTYVKGLDERISGGIPEKQIVLVGGAHGTMKSTFCFSILYNLAKEEKTKCAYLTLEQGRESLIKNMQSLGMDVNTVEENLYIFDIGEIRKILAESGPAKTKMTWMDSILFHIEKLKEIENVEVVVLDSLNALAEISSAEKPTRDIIFHFFEKFRKMGITTFMISEIGQQEYRFAQFGCEGFLSDALIHLNFERDKRSLKLFVGVLKMRETNIDRTYFPLIYTSRGFAIAPE